MVALILPLFLPSILSFVCVCVCVSYMCPFLPSGFRGNYISQQLYLEPAVKYEK